MKSRLLGEKITHDMNKTKACQRERKYLPVYQQRAYHCLQQGYKLVQQGHLDLAPLNFECSRPAARMSSTKRTSVMM